MEPKEALRLQKENNFVILDVRPEAEFKEVSEQVLQALFSSSYVPVHSCCIFCVSLVLLLGFNRL